MDSVCVLEIESTVHAKELEVERERKRGHGCML